MLMIFPNLKWKIRFYVAWQWYVHFASCFYIDIYCIMGCYYTLYHNTYAFSLLFYKVYMKRENAGSWNSGLEKEQIWETYSAQLQKSWKSTENYFGIYKKYWAKKAPEGGHQPSTRVGARPTPWARLPTLWAPWQASSAHLLLYGVFWPEKIKRKLTGWSAAVSRRNLGRTNLGLRRSCSARETSLREGEIEAIVITNDPLIERGSIYWNIVANGW
jgi:hypothetical protein